MDALRIASILFDHGIDTNDPKTQVIIVDSSYAETTREWIAGTFSQAWMSLKSQLNFTYVDEAEDCDDFSRFCAGYASYVYKNAKSRVPGTALCFGEFGFIRDADKQAHAINIAIVVEKGAYDVVFYEPQTCQLIDLSPSEKLSCLYIRI